MNSRVKVIVKNSGFLYIRLILVTLVTLYTSRLVLKVLGVDDFGIYSVVGSVTTTFLSLRSVFSEALLRFFNYEKGLGNDDNVRKLFGMSIILHVFVAIFFLVVVEVVGLWLIYNKLNIPIERIDTAIFIFHVSVLSCVIFIFTVPYDAVIISNEKIGIYSIVSVFEAIAKLAIIIVVPFLSFDYLKSYSLLLLFVPLSTLIIYVSYCSRFNECRLSLVFDRKLFKDLGIYASWNFLGNFIYSIVHEMYNILLNIYGGVIENASRNIAYQVKFAINSFSNNALVAVKPFVIQEAAINEVNVLFNHTILLSKVSLYLSLVISAPIILYCDELLNLWLTEVPSYAIVFTQLTVGAILIRSLHGPLSLMYMSMGKIKWMTIVEGSIFLLSLLIAWIILSCGLPSWLIFALLCLIEMITIISLAYNAKIEFAFSFNEYFRVMVKLTILSIIVIGLSFCLRQFFLPESWYYLLFYISIDIFLVVLVIWLFFTKAEKDYTRIVIHSIINNIK